MINLVHDLSPMLLAVIAAAFAWFMRMRASEQATSRARRLEQAGELLAVHNRALEHLLDDHEAPDELKRLMISFSDSMADREAVKQMAEWASSRPLDQPVDTEESRAIEGLLAPLRGSRPDLIEDFNVAILTAIAGGSLRWPESAAVFEQTFPRLMATPRRDVAIAATATTLRAGLPFSLKPMAPAAV